ncbi:MAG: 1-acyl-sn-glycerol-3-phosphate acyltransferase [Planctomycetes bacterium]|nr:1-acyl-sn-glycerol-3-phosphate acyltransferase [Planctomycetota bacterium]
MQNIVIARPYEFVPPRGGALWPTLLRLWVPGHLRRTFGVTSIECRHVERLQASVDAGHGILLAPNHCRPYDPFAVDWLGRAVGRNLHIMAGWHLFMQSRLQRWLLPRAGVFSVYREGTDRESLKCAITILTEAKRPLVLFPEGVVSRHNDRLNPLMDGTALMARSAAKERAKSTPPGRVVVHPVAIRWVFDGDVDATLGPMLDDIERRLAWRPRPGLPLAERIRQVGAALLASKEVEVLGAASEGTFAERTVRLVERLLCPLEDEWLKGRHDGGVVARGKSLRAAIVPGLAQGDLDGPETARRWRQLEDIYLAQQFACYPAGYLDSPTPERLLETVERFEEDLTDNVRRIPGIRGFLYVGEAIDVAPERQRGVAGDPLMALLRERLESMLAASLAEHRPGAVLP